MELPILYSFRRCPYAIRARMALAISGRVCHIREVKLSRKPAELIEASPKATVPVLVLSGGEVMAESIGIMTWALKLQAGRRRPVLVAAGHRGAAAGAVVRVEAGRDPLPANDR